MADDNLGDTAGERLKNLIDLLSKKLLIDFQTLVVILLVLFLGVVGFLLVLFGQ